MVDVVHRDGYGAVEEGEEAEQGGDDQHGRVEAEPREVQSDPAAKG